MKKLFFILMFFPLFSSSQNKTNDEYEIYANIIGNQGFQFYPINFNIPDKYKFPINDSIYKEIEKLPNKEFDLKKILSESLKYSIGKTFKVFESNLNKQIYFSPIYFKNKEEAYLIYINTDNKSKPYIYFFQTKKINNKWEFYDYYEMY